MFSFSLNNVNTILGFVRRNIRINSIHMNNLAFNMLDRLKMEYASAFRDPYQSDLIAKLYKVPTEAARSWQHDRCS